MASVIAVAQEAARCRILGLADCVQIPARSSIIFISRASTIVTVDSCVYVE